ncbi:hypothetical protein PTTG_29517, partial [Puccinia triticina 1-1 BBBD Race 1]
MVRPLSDSRVSINRAPNKKRPAVASSESGQSNVQSQAKSKGKKNAKKSSQPRISTSGESSAKNKPSGSKPIQKKKKSSAPNDVPSEGEEEGHDYNQISENESIEIKRQARIGKKDKFDNILDFFEAPTSKPTDKSTEPINYKCKWWKGNYRAHETTKGNLWAHRDGSTQAGKNAKGCINRNLAKKLGAKLPPSVAEKKLVDS